MGQAAQTETAGGPATWLERHGDALFRFALLHLAGDRQAAEDVVQEAFLAALKAQERFAGRSDERTWLIGILKHKVVDHIRRAARLKPVGELPGGDDVADAAFDHRGYWSRGPERWGGDPARASADREFRDALVDCLAKLPPAMAHAFALREMEGVDTEEICKILAVTPTNLWTMLHRARARLRTCLERRYFGRSPKGQR